MMESYILMTSLCHKWDWIHLVDFPAFCTRETTLWSPVCVTAHQALLKKRLNLCPRSLLNGAGTQIFPFKEDPFSEGRHNNTDRVASPKGVSSVLNLVRLVWMGQLNSRNTNFKYNAPLTLQQAWYNFQQMTFFNMIFFFLILIYLRKKNDTSSNCLLVSKSFFLGKKY